MATTRTADGHFGRADGTIVELAVEGKSILARSAPHGRWYYILAAKDGTLYRNRFATNCGLKTDSEGRVVISNMVIPDQPRELRASNADTPAETKCGDYTIYTMGHAITIRADGHWIGNNDGTLQLFRAGIRVAIFKHWSGFEAPHEIGAL